MCALGNLERYLAVQGGHFNLRAQCGLGEGNGYFAVHMDTVPFKDGMLPDVNIHHQIAVGTAIAAYAAFSPNPDGLSVVDACRHFDLDFLGAADFALATAGVAGILDDFATAGTLGTGGSGLHLHTHNGLHRADLTAAPTLGAGLHLAVGRATAVTDGAVLNSLGGNILFYAESGFFKGQIQPGAYILTPPGRIVVAPLAATAKERTKDIAQIAKIAETTEATAVTAGAGAEIRVYDWEGEMPYRIPLRTEDEIEPENLNIVNGEAYILCNTWPKNETVGIAYRVELIEVAKEA